MRYYDHTTQKLYLNYSLSKMRLYITLHMWLSALNVARVSRLLAYETCPTYFAQIDVGRITPKPVPRPSTTSPQTI